MYINAYQPEWMTVHSLIIITSSKLEKYTIKNHTKLKTVTSHLA